MRLMISEVLQQSALDDMVNGHRRVPDDPTFSSSSPVGASSPQKPALGFPLGTALILFIVFGVSTVFSCCYHWEKIRIHAYRFTGNRRLQPRPPPSETGSDTSLDTSETGETDHRGALNNNRVNHCEAEKPKCSKQVFSLPVMMPGDEFPKYVAWASPLKEDSVYSGLGPRQPHV